MLNFPLTKGCNNARPPDTAKPDEKQDCQYWILCLVVFTRFPANRDWLLKLCMLVKSARTVSQRVYFWLTSYGLLRALRQYFAAVQTLSSCCLPSAYGKDRGLKKIYFVWLGK